VLSDSTDSTELTNPPNQDDLQQAVQTTNTSLSGDNFQQPAQPTNASPSLDSRQQTDLSTKPRKRGKSFEVSKKMIAERFFAKRQTVSSSTSSTATPNAASADTSMHCKICSYEVSCKADRSNSNLIRHLTSNNTHAIRVDGKSVIEHWNLILKKAENLTLEQTLAMVDSVIERCAAAKIHNLKQMKITACIRRANATTPQLPELESKISEENMHLSNLEYQCFIMLGNLLRNQSFTSLEDEFEKFHRSLIYFQNPHSLDPVFAQSEPRSYRQIATESRTTYVSNYLPILEEAANSETRKLLEQVHFGAIVSDGWSSRPANQVHRFTGLCLSYVQWPTMKLESHILHFEPHSSSHTAQNLSTAYIRSIEKFLPPNFQVANHTCDNAANETLSARLVLEKMGFWKDPENCLAHTIQLDLNEILSLPMFQNLIYPIMKINSRLVNSSSLKNEFLDYQQTFGPETLMPCSQVKTRWWSILPGLSFFVRRRDVLITFFHLKEPNFWIKLAPKRMGQVTPPSFDEALALSKYLNFIKAQSDLLSAENAVTSPLVIKSILQIQNSQVNLPNSEPLTPVFPRLGALLKRVSLWSKASFFHPRGLLALKSVNPNGFDLYSATKDSVFADLTKISENLVGTAGNDPTNPFRYVGFQSATLGILEALLDQNQTEELNILCYYSEDILPKLSISSPHEASCLKTLLSLLFSIPATQLSCERLFSSAGQVCDPSRNAMTSSTLSALVTIQKVFPNKKEGIFRALNAIRAIRLTRKASEQPISLS